MHDPAGVTGSGPSDGGAAASGGWRARPVGAYRRAVRIAIDEGQATAEMADDVHDFAVVVRHAKGVVAAVAGEARRTPWTVCPGAVGALMALEGMPLVQVGRMAAGDRAEQCMHMLDLAVLAAAHAGEPGLRREYRIEVDHDQVPPRARLWRDGRDMLAWAIDRGVARGSRFDGFALKDLPRHLAHCTPDEAEAALLLRRASLISFVRLLDLDRFPDAQSTNPRAPANCYAKQAGRRDVAFRNRGSARDYSGAGAWPLEAGGVEPAS